MSKTVWFTTKLESQRIWIRLTIIVPYDALHLYHYILCSYHYELDPSSSSSEPSVADKTSARFNRMEEEVVNSTVIAAIWIRWSYNLFPVNFTTSCLFIFAYFGKEAIFLFNISIWPVFITDFSFIWGENLNDSGFRLQNHTVSHLHYTSLWAIRIDWEKALAVRIVARADIGFMKKNCENAPVLSTNT